MTSMFSSPKRPESYPPASSPSAAPSAASAAKTTVIARGVRVEGEFSSQGDVLIEGEVHGHLTTSGLLTVGAEAKLKADVAAQDASIAGMVEGNILIKKRLELKATARIVGDLVCEVAVVEAGATVSGKVSIGSSSKPEPSSKKPTS